MMNPWQQLKLTLLTLGSVLRGNALAPQGYNPVDSAVRGEAEVNAMLAVSTIKGGIKVGVKSRKAETVSVNNSEPDQDREPVLAGKD
jgi:geranylgeranyl reductase